VDTVLRRANAGSAVQLQLGCRYHISRSHCEGVVQVLDEAGILQSKMQRLEVTCPQVRSAMQRPPYTYRLQWPVRWQICPHA
jgi:hypothetical protein